MMNNARLAAIIASVLAIFIATSGISGHALAEDLTGCLTKSGRLEKVAIGDAPSRPCHRHDQQITLKTDGAGPPEEPGGTIVFVTSEVFTGALGGIAGADQKCQDAADAAGLPGTFRALISDGVSAPAIDPTFFKSPNPYVRVDRVTVAADWDDLVDGSILAAIEVDEFGNHPVVSGERIPFVWTNVNALGLPEGGINDPYYHCEGWTSTNRGFDTGGISGVIWSINRYEWTKDGPRECRDTFHLYCFQQE